MKQKIVLLWMACGLLLVPGTLHAVPVGHPPTAGAGIANSPHDFTQAGYAASPPPGLCTFCHTPHKAQATALLWNHTYSDNTYSWTDNTKTQAGTTLPSFTKTWNGPSPKCLSCHDGSVAVGDVKWFDAKAQTISVTAADLTGGKITNTDYVVGPAGSMNGNHPVVVPFPGVGTRNFGGTTTGGGYEPTEWSADPTANGIVLFKASDNTLAATVSRVTASPSAGDNLGIECASCHDPHNKLTQDIYFLRGKLTGNTSGASGYICLKCHVK